MVLDKTAIMIKPDTNVPNPKEKAQRAPSNAPLEIIVISKSKAISGAQGDIPAIKPRINKLPKVKVLFTGNLQLQQN